MESEEHDDLPPVVTLEEPFKILDVKINKVMGELELRIVLEKIKPLSSIQMNYNWEKLGLIDTNHATTNETQK